jgi:hypothetical protein
LLFTSHRGGSIVITYPPEMLPSPDPDDEVEIIVCDHDSVWLVDHRGRNLSESQTESQWFARYQKQATNPKI